MPRGGRNKTHKQHHKQSVKELEGSDEGESTRYGPELLPEPRAEGKRGREELKVEFPGEKYDIQKKKSQQQSRELGPGSSPATYFSAKRKRGTEPSGIEASALTAGVVDRWNGGEIQGVDALSSLPYHSRTDSESSERNFGVLDSKDDFRVEEKGKKWMKGTKLSVIEFPDSMKSGKSKGSKRREAHDSAFDQGSSMKFAEDSQSKVNSGASNVGKLDLMKLGSKGKWDKGMVARRDPKEVDEGTGTSSHDVQRNSDREKKVRNIKTEKTSGSMPAAFARNYEGNRIEGFREDSSIKQEQKNAEWQLQEDVRNIELEKELENRIQRRREESGERDRWRDDDRDLEGICVYRDERKKDDRYKDEKQRDDRYKDDKHNEKNKDDNCREEKYAEDYQRDDKHQDSKHREWQVSREQINEKYDSKHCRDGRFKENKHFDNDRDHSSYYDDQHTQIRVHRDRSSLEPVHEDSKDTISHGKSIFPVESDYRGSNTGLQDENREHGKLLVALPNLETGDTTNDKKMKRLRGFGSEVCREERRLKFKQVDSESRDTLPEQRPQHTKNERFARNMERVSGHSREPGNLHYMNKTEKKLESNRDESPLGSARSAYDGRTSPGLSHVECSPKNNGTLSPVNKPRKSPSPYVHELGYSLISEKTDNRNKFETGNNVSAAGVMHNRSSHYFSSSNRDRQLSMADETSSREPQGLYRSTEDHRRSPSTERVHDSLMNNHANDESSRAPYSSSSRVGSSQDLRRMSTGGTSAPLERSSKIRRIEETPSSRSDWTVHPTQMNRPAESSIRAKVSTLIGRPSGLLPPPPPLRPGIDNPAMLGSSSTGFDEAPSSREQRRADRQTSGHFKRGDVMVGSGQVDAWKNVGNWNSHGQGQGPGNMFVPYQHHIAGHPHGGFLNIGQPFPGPPMFGLRPTADMANLRFPVRDGVDAFPGHSRSFGWQRPADDLCVPHIQVPLHGWEGPGSYGEESNIYGRNDRDQIAQGMGTRSWERTTDMWKANSRETDESWGGSQVSRGRLEKNRKERSPTESIEIKRSNESIPPIIKENQCSNMAPDVRKQNKNKHDRISVYLSKLDISAELAGTELYNKCAQMLDLKAHEINNAAVLKDSYTEDVNGDFQLEVDADAEALLHSLNMQSGLFPSLPKEIFERAFALYKYASEESKLEPAVGSHSNPKLKEVLKVNVASESSKEDLPYTELQDKANAHVDVAVASENTSTDLTSAMELQGGEGVVKNQLKLSEEGFEMSTDGDPEGNSLSVSFEVKESVVDVTPMGNLQVLDDGNTKICLEQPAEDVSTGRPSSQSAEDIASLQVDAHGTKGLSEESVIVPDMTHLNEEPAYSIVSVQFSRILVDSDNAVGSSEQVECVTSLEECNKASCETKEIVLTNNMEESMSILSGCMQDDLRRNQSLPNDCSGTIESRGLIAESGSDEVSGRCGLIAKSGNDDIPDICGLVAESGNDDVPDSCGLVAESGNDEVPESCGLIAELGNDEIHVEYSASAPYIESVRKCEEGESDFCVQNSNTVNQEFYRRNDDLELNAAVISHAHPNQVNNLCGETGILQDESPKNSDIALEKEVESVDSKIGILNFNPYNLPGSTH